MPIQETKMAKVLMQWWIQDFQKRGAKVHNLDHIHVSETPHIMAHNLNLVFRRRSHQYSGAYAVNTNRCVGALSGVSHLALNPIIRLKYFTYVPTQGKIWRLVGSQ